MTKDSYKSSGNFFPNVDESIGPKENISWKCFDNLHLRTLWVNIITFKKQFLDNLTSFLTRDRNIKYDWLIKYLVFAYHTFRVSILFYKLF